MVFVVMRRDHRIQVDPVETIVLEEFPVDEVAGALPSVLLLARIAAVDQDMPEVGCQDEDPIALTDVDDVQLEERPSAIQRIDIDPAGAVPAARPDLALAARNLAADELDAIPPEQVRDDRVVIGRDLNDRRVRSHICVEWRLDHGILRNACRGAVERA